MRTADWMVRELRELDVDWMATLCGHGLDPLFDAARKAGLKLIDTRNEQTAAYAAEAYGRLTRRPGVCAVSSGVAHVNALAGVANAHFDGAPMLLISGAGAFHTAGLDHFQDLDQVALAAPVTRFARVLDCPERVVQILHQAFGAAMGTLPGPVHLTFPMDIQMAEVEPSRMMAPVPGAPPAALGRDDPGQVADALARAERPLLVAGSGVWYSGGAEDLTAFAEQYSIPMVTPIWDRGCVGRPAASFMGVIGAASGGPALLPDADCIVMAGARPDYRVGFLQPPAVRPDAVILELCGQWKALRQAYEAAGGRSHGPWLEEAARRRGEFRARVDAAAAAQAASGLHASHLISALKEILTDDTSLLVDGGSIGQWVHQLLCDRYPGHWLTCGRSGVVGWGLGGAMGARLAFPDRPVLLLSGDGAFTFNVADLECAVRQSLPFVALVADDEAWGITRTGHVRQFGEPIHSSLGPIRFASLAESLGARGVTVDRPEQVAPALRQALSRAEVTVVHARIVGGNP